MGIFDLFKSKKNKPKEELSLKKLMSFNNCNEDDFECLFHKETIVGGGKGLMIFSDDAILRYSNGGVLCSIKIQAGKIERVMICPDLSDKNLL